MSNVLDDTKQQQILALGRLGWSLRRIEQALAIRRKTISGYLKAAGIAVHAAVTALLDRLLHHAHVLKCGPRSWRTKLQTDLRSDNGTK